MTEQRPLTDTDEPIGTGTPDAAGNLSDDVEGHGLISDGFQRAPATSRTAERPAGSGCRTPVRDPHPRHGRR
jgi:hypothetical protein